MRGVAKIAEVSRDRITGQAQRRLKYCCVGGVNVLLGLYKADAKRGVHMLDG